LESTTDILKRLQDEMNSKYENATPGFFTYDVLKSEAVEFKKLYEAIQVIADKLDPRNLTGEDLERETSLRRGIIRKKATKSTGELIVNGTGNIVIGSLFSTADNVQFVSTENKTISGTDIIQIECTDFGTIGNIGVGLINQMPITIQGITSVTNEIATFGGYEQETDTSLLERYLYDIQNPITSNNIYQFEKWARDVPGVGKAKIFPTWNGNNSVKVVILDDDMLPAPSNIVETAQTYIDPIGIDLWGKGYGKSALGSYCTVISATAKTININVDIAKSDNYNLTNIETSFKTTITEYFKEIAFDELINFISYAKISSLIINTPGVLDVSNLKINDGTSNIDLNSEEVAILGTTVIEVV